MPRAIQGEFNHTASALIDALGGTGALARQLKISPSAVSNYRKLGIALKQYRSITTLCANNGIELQEAAFAQDSTTPAANTITPSANNKNQDALARLRQRIHAGFDFAQAGERVVPNTIQPADPYLDLLGPDMRRKMWLIRNDSGDRSDLCLLPDYTIATARRYLRLAGGAPKPARYWYDGGRFRRDGDDPRNRQDEEVGFESFAHPDPLADELMLLGNMRHLLQLAGIQQYQLRLNDIGLLQSLMKALTLNSSWQSELRRALQTQRLGRFWENQELLAQDMGSSRATEQDESGRDSPISIDDRTDTIPTTNLPFPASVRPLREVLPPLRHFLALHGDGPQTKTALQNLAQNLPEKIDDEMFHNAMTHFCERLDKLLDIGYAPSQIRFAPQTGYELDYYSGLVFTITRPDSQIILASGGRYDKLLSRLGSAAPMSACGGAMRLRALLQTGD